MSTLGSIISKKEEKVMKYEEVEKYSDRKFKRVVGINRTTFKLLVDIVGKEYKEKHLRGRSTKLSVEDMLLVAMEYWYEERTYEQIAASYGLAASNVCRSIKWIENVLEQDGTFQVSTGLMKVPETFVRMIPEANRRYPRETAAFGD